MSRLRTAGEKLFSVQVAELNRRGAARTCPGARAPTHARRLHVREEKDGSRLLRVGLGAEPGTSGKC